MNVIRKLTRPRPRWQPPRALRCQVLIEIDWARTKRLSAEQL
jgi:hypothetical protein